MTTTPELCPDDGTPVDPVLQVCRLGHDEAYPAEFAAALPDLRRAR
jgi:hypothetical protein